MGFLNNLGNKVKMGLTPLTMGLIKPSQTQQGKTATGVNVTAPAKPVTPAPSFLNQVKTGLTPLTMGLVKPSTTPAKPVAPTLSGGGSWGPAAPAAAPTAVNSQISAVKQSMDPAPQPTYSIPPKVPAASPASATPATPTPASQAPTTPPPAPQAPMAAAAPSAPAALDYQDQLDALRQSIAKSYQLSPEEQQYQQQLTDLNNEARQASAGMEGAGRGFTTGYVTGVQGAIGRQRSIAELPLLERIANIQAARTGQQQADSTKLGFLEKDIDRAQGLQDKQASVSREDATAKRAIILQAIQGGANQETLQAILNASTPDEAIRIAGASLKKPGENTTVSPGQTVIGPDGKAIYSAPVKAEETEGAKLLSPSEAKELGVAYGTTREQAYGKNVTGSPTVEQSKARDFYSNAINAQQVLDSVNYNPGIVENPYLPNVLKGEDRQKAEQASRAFVNAILRRESGATITDDEFKNKQRELIPQAGDSDGVLKQKKVARQAAVQSLQSATGQDQDPLGLGFNSAQTPALNGSTAMRTDRHNNPAAFTTDIAKMAGLKEGVDYAVGDEFGGGQYHTARLLGNPVDQTIKVIDNIGFYTQSGQPRWTHTAIPKNQWNGLSYQQKKSVVKQMYQHEGNRGQLNSYFA